MKYFTKLHFKNDNRREKEAALLREEVKKEISSLKEKLNKVPGLSVILIGDFVPSLIYVKIKKKVLKKLALNLK